jgi:hypothetical protein
MCRRSKHDEIHVLSSPLRDLHVKMDDIERFTSSTFPVKRASIALRIVARMAGALSVETKRILSDISVTSAISTPTVVSVEGFCDQSGKRIRNGQLPHSDKRAEAVHRNRPFILNSVATFDVLLLAFFK